MRPSCTSRRRPASARRSCWKRSTRSRRRATSACPRRSSIASSSRVTREHPPVSPGHRNVRVLYAAQTGVAPPTFVLFTNVATKLHFSYERFLAEPAPREVRLRRDADHDRGSQAIARSVGRPNTLTVGDILDRIERSDRASMASAKRELFKSIDVCEMAQLQPYVLRSWEAEFPALGQPAARRRSRVSPCGRRVRAADQAAGLQRRTDAGRGAKRRLEEAQEGPSMAVVAVSDALDEMARSRLKQVRMRARSDPAAAESRCSVGIARTAARAAGCADDAGTLGQAVGAGGAAGSRCREARVGQARACVMTKERRG